MAYTLEALIAARPVAAALAEALGAVAVPIEQGTARSTLNWAGDR